MIYLWWSLYTLYLHACQVRVTVGNSDLFCLYLCYVVWVLINCIDSAWALWASFCFRFVFLFVFFFTLNVSLLRVCSRPMLLITKKSKNVLMYFYVLMVFLFYVCGSLWRGWRRWDWRGSESWLPCGCNELWTWLLCLWLCVEEAVFLAPPFENRHAAAGHDPGTAESAQHPHQVLCWQSQKHVCHQGDLIPQRFLPQVSIGTQKMAAFDEKHPCTGTLLACCSLSWHSLALLSCSLWMAGAVFHMLLIYQTKRPVCVHLPEQTGK